VNSSAHGVPRRELAPGYSVAAIINGGWQLSHGHRQQPLDRGDSMDGLLALVDAGFTTFDCGDIYLGVEEFLGELLARYGARESAAPPLQIHTKFVPDLDSLAHLKRTDVQRILHRSLRRLGVERLDLVQFMWWDYSVPRYVEVARWLDDFRREGKIHLLGVTNFDVSHLKEIVDAGVEPAVNQVQYSMLDHRPRRGMLAFCQEHAIQLLAYGTLAGGFLSPSYLGRPDPGAHLPNRSLVKYRLIIDEFGGWNEFQQLLVAMDRIATRRGVSLSNVAIRWVLDQPQIAAAIIGAGDARHLEENLRTFNLSLDEADLELLSPFSNRGPEGDVYGVERLKGGPHAAIMKYNLNSNAEV
jgi:aryl-alcohol dehydrogenase-like predicted oxidoreductase